MLFADKVTARSKDDDLALLESSLAALSGFKYLREGHKGKGIQQTTAHRALSSLFLGGRLAAKGETVMQAAQILAQQALGARRPLLAKCDGNIFAQDRGRQSIATTNYFSKIGAAPLGAHKRAPRFAFTYGRDPRPQNKQIAILTCGARSGSCARRILEDGSELWALAYREPGSRARARLMQCKDIPELFRMGSCSAKPLQRKSWWQEADKRAHEPQNLLAKSHVREHHAHGGEILGRDLVVSRESKSVIHLTVSQSPCSSWLILRKESISPTVSIGLLRAAQRGGCRGLNRLYQDLFFALGMARDQAHAADMEEEDEGGAAARPNEIESLAFDELKAQLNTQQMKDLCRKHDLMISGNKRALAERLHDHFRSEAAEIEPILSDEALEEKMVKAAIRMWRKKPLDPADKMKASLCSESSALRRFPSLYDDHYPKADAEPLVFLTVRGLLSSR